MWVKTTYCCCLCLLLIIRKSIYNLVLVQTHTSTQTPTCKRVQPSLVLQLLMKVSDNPPSSCTSQYVYQYLGASLQKTPLFNQGPRFMNFQTGSTNSINQTSRISASTNYLFTNQNKHISDECTQITVTVTTHQI